MKLRFSQIYAILTAIALCYLAVTGYADDQVPARPVPRLTIDEDVLYEETNKLLRLAAINAGVKPQGHVKPATVRPATYETPSEDAYDAPVSLDLSFIYHVDADMHEQDVFIEREPGSGEVWRVTKADNNMNAPLYRAAVAVEHAPFEPDKTGPFPKGDALGITVGEWFAGQGQGTYTCTNGQGRIDVQFTNLVPNSAYTMWHWFVAMPPTTPFIGTYDLPIGARDGSQSVFRSDSEGNARFQREFKPCLQMTGEHLAGALAVTWHSDGQTYGVVPGEFATDSHVQMFLVLPKRSGI